MSIIGVYKIECVPTGRYYVGSSCDIRKRKRRHLKDLRLGKHHNAFLQRVFDKYGEDSLVFKIKRTETAEDALLLEQHYLYKAMHDKRAMNIGVHASGGDTLTNNPRREEIIAQRTATIRAKLDAMTSEEKKRLFGSAGNTNGMYGKTHTVEARKKISEANTGQARNRGIRKSAEGRANIKAGAIARASAEEYVNPFAGKSHTAEAKQRMGAANVGRRPTNARRVKIGKEIFNTVKEAARHYRVANGTICYRLKSDDFPDYTYLD